MRSLMDSDQPYLRGLGPVKTERSSDCGIGVPGCLPASSWLPITWAGRPGVKVERPVEHLQPLGEQHESHKSPGAGEDQHAYNTDETALSGGDQGARPARVTVAPGP
jgi:hypothetical protein